MKTEFMKRRDFIARAFGGILFSFISVRFLAGCGKEETASAPEAGGCGVSYTNPGHAHTVVNLTAAEKTAGAAGTYTLMGGSHIHTFTLTAEDFTTLKAGTAITKPDLEGDGHIIKITC